VLSERKTLLSGDTRTKGGSNMSSKGNCGEVEELKGMNRADQHQSGADRC